MDILYGLTGDVSKPKKVGYVIKYIRFWIFQTCPFSDIRHLKQDDAFNRTVVVSSFN